MKGLFNINEKIATLSKTREILKKNNFILKKSLGQNFLTDIFVLEQIINSAQVCENDCVLEIGAGIGSLTQSLAENAQKVIAVEIDSKLIPILKDNLKYYDNIEILDADILKLDIAKLITEKNNGKQIKVVANLPYYITTPIIMGLLEQKLAIESITVMIQKEVAQRMQALPSTKDYGALSLAVQYYSKPEIVAEVSAECFIPKPNVDSAVICLKILTQPSIKVKDEELLFKLIKIGFGQRRKTLVNCLNNSSEINMKKENISDMLNKLGLDKNIRGEALSLEQFGLLADNIYSVIE